MMTETQKAKSAIKRAQRQTCLSTAEREQIMQLLEVLADTEEIGRQGVVEQEVLDLLLDRRAALVGVVFQSAAIADFGIEHLAGGERFVALDEFKDVVWQGVVAAPRHIGKRVIDDDRHDVRVFLEHLA